MTDTKDAREALEYITTFARHSDQANCSDVAEIVRDEATVLAALDELDRLREQQAERSPPPGVMAELTRLALSTGKGLSELVEAWTQFSDVVKRLQEESAAKSEDIRRLGVLVLKLEQRLTAAPDLSPIERLLDGVVQGPAPHIIWPSALRLALKSAKVKA
jgi:hypothetical protein